VTADPGGVEEQGADLDVVLVVGEGAKERAQVVKPDTPTTRPDRQAIWACVPLVDLKGDSYRLRDKDLGARPGAQPAEIA
jgi:hypothetical protein